MSATTISPLIDQIARSQHAVVTREDLLQRGVPRSDVDRAVARRQLLPVHPGVFTTAGVELGWRSSAYANYRYLDRAVRRKHRPGRPLPAVALTGVAELALRGVPGVTPPEVPLLVTDPASRSRRVLHRHREGLQARPLPIVEQFPTTGLHWAMAEAVHVLPGTTFDNVVSWLLRGSMSMGDLLADVDALPAVVGQALAHRVRSISPADVRARSGQERRLHRAVVAAGLPAPLVNATLRLAGQRHEVDLYWPPPHSLVFEIDGPHHDLANQRRRDRVREAAAESDGLRIDRCTVGDLDASIDDVVRHIARLLATTP